MARKTSKKRKSKKEIPLWFVDGVLGILALVIYNFSLYLIRISGTQGFLREIEKNAGSFGINSFATFNFSETSTIIGVLGIFGFSFFLGICIGNKVRKYRKRKTRK